MSRAWPRRPLVILVLGFGLALACAGRTDAPSTDPPSEVSVTERQIEVLRQHSPADAVVQPWKGLQIEGGQIYKVSTERAVFGALFLDGAAEPLTGAAAMKTQLGRGETDAGRLATLAMLFVDTGDLDRLPITDPSEVAGHDWSPLVHPPLVDGNTLVYWRRNSLAPSVVCVRIDLESLEPVRDNPDQILANQAAEADPFGEATRKLASKNQTSQLAGVKILAGCSGPEAAGLLGGAARGSWSPEVREAAVDALVGCPGPGTATDLAGVLATDKEARVRMAAARALGQVGDAAARAALERAANKDADGDVRRAAQTALEAVGG